jgi:glycosyltransferase involved in cell wall biosynthesis
MKGFDGLRLTIVGPLPPPPGGMANQTIQLAQLVEQAGAHVVAVQTNAPYRPRWVASIPVVRAGFRLLPYLIRLWRAAGRSDLFHVMANSGWSWHLFAAPAIRIAAYRRVPVVVNYRGGEAATFLRRSHRSVRNTMRRASKLIVPSGYLREVFAEHDMPAEVVPNVVDLRLFQPGERYGSAGHLVVMRNLEPIYDNETAIRALALVRKQAPQAHLTVAGVGPELARLESLAAELGLAGAVRFAGRLDRRQVAALYRAADIVLNPSTADNMPNSVLEALASGVPVVSTDVGGVPFLVEHGRSALLVPARDPEAMARAVISLLDDPERKRNLVAAGLARVRQFAWSEVSPVLAEVYARAAQLRA